MEDTCVLCADLRSDGGACWSVVKTEVWNCRGLKLWKRACGKKAKGRILLSDGKGPSLGDMTCPNGRATLSRAVDKGLYVRQPFSR